MAQVIKIMLSYGLLYGCFATYDYYTLYVDTCGEPIIDPKNQQFTYDKSAKTIKASAYNDAYCVFAQGNSNPVATTTCNSSDAAQQWTYNSQTGQFSSTMNTCLDVYDYTGDNVEEFACKTGSGPQNSNQAFAINEAQGIITNTYNDTNTNQTTVKCVTLLKPQ